MTGDPNGANGSFLHRCTYRISDELTPTNPFVRPAPGFKSPPSEVSTHMNPWCLTAIRLVHK